MKLVDDIYAKHTNTAWHESTDPNYEERLRRIGACENTEKVWILCLFLSFLFGFCVLILF